MLSKELERGIQVAKITMQLPTKSMKLDDDRDKQWDILNENLQNLTLEIFKQAQQKDSDKAALIAKLMTLKDNLLKTLCEALIYKKIILWMDLGIQSDDYIRNTVVQKLNDMIMSQKKVMKFVSTQMSFPEFSMEDRGVYNVEMGRVLNMEDTGFGHMLVLAEVFNDMEEMIKQNFNLSEEKKSRFVRQNKVMMTLREELEEVHLEKSVLQEKIDRLNKELMKTDDAP